MLTCVLSVHQYWQEIRKPKSKFFSTKSVIWPNSRYGHAGSVIGYLHVMMMGGYTYPNIGESWLFNLNTNTWTKVSY